MPQFIRTEKKAHRLDVTINNPPVNILTGEVMHELNSVLKSNADDMNLRVVVLKGEGKAWSAGADVNEHLPEKFVEMLDIFGELCWRVRTYPIPTIASVDGVCLGGGCEVAALCDFILASNRAKFGQPEIKVGVIPPAACAHYAWKYGMKTALEIILTGRTYDAETFMKMGIVHSVVGSESLEMEVSKLADDITAQSGMMLRIAKKAVLKAARRKPKDAANYVDEMYVKKLMTTRDALEGLRAFVEKRIPNWQDA